MFIPPNFHENVERRQNIKVQSFQSFDKRIPQISCNADELSKTAPLYNNMLKTSVIWKLEQTFAQIVKQKINDKTKRKQNLIKFNLRTMKL